VLRNVTRWPSSVDMKPAPPVSTALLALRSQMWAHAAASSVQRGARGYKGETRLPQ
jgi:hypothetical protein